MERSALSSKSTARTTTCFAAAAAVLALVMVSRASAVQGPVVFGGDNFARHGQFNTTTNLLEDG